MPTVADFKTKLLANRTVMRSVQGGRQVGRPAGRKVEGAAGSVYCSTVDPALDCAHNLTPVVRLCPLTATSHAYRDTQNRDSQPSKRTKARLVGT